MIVYIVRNFYTNQLEEVFSTREAAEKYIEENDSEFGVLDILEKKVR